MTDDKIALSTLLEKSSDASFLREMIGFAAERLMQLETETIVSDALWSSAVVFDFWVRPWWAFSSTRA